MDEQQVQQNNNQEPQLTKKERADLSREEKAKAQQKKRQTRKTKKIAKIGGIIVVIAGLLYWGVTAIENSNASRPGEQVSVQGVSHIGVTEKHKAYNSNPPTSGAHGSPVNPGVYTEELIDENVVHNMEHGGIWISYTGITDAEIAQLVSIARRHSRSVVLSPRNSNDSPIAVASWGRLMKLETIDEEAIEEYIRKNINKSPEPQSL